MSSLDAERDQAREALSVFRPPAGEEWYAPVFLGPATIAERAWSESTWEAVRHVLDVLAPDPYNEYLKSYVDEGRRRFGHDWRYLDIMNVCHAAATLLRPRRYLEIGVRKGRSMAMVLDACPETAALGFDLWQQGYAGIDNPGAAFVTAEMERVAPGAHVELVDGDSHVTVPAAFKRSPSCEFDLVTVDGDHSRRGALSDLRTVLPHLALGGVLVFDDIVHPSHEYLLQVWRRAVADDGGLQTYEFCELGYGVAFAVRVRPSRLAPRAGRGAVRP